MFSNMLLALLLFLAVSHCSLIDDLKKQEESILQRIAKLSNNASSELETSRYNVASEILRASSLVLESQYNLNAAFEYYENLTQKANKSLTECYLDELAYRQILAVNITQILDCANSNTYKKGDSYIVSLNRLVDEVKHIIRDCTVTTYSEKVLQDCAIGKFETISSAIGNYEFDLKYIFGESSSMFAGCILQSSNRRPMALELIRQEFSECAENILKS